MGVCHKTGVCHSSNPIRAEVIDRFLTFEGVVIAPMWEHTGLDLLIEALLHAVHILELVRLNTLILVPFSACNRFLHR